MHIYWCKKRYLNLTALVLAAFVLWLFVLSWLRPTAAPASASPIYHGSGEEAVVSLAVNVDWGTEYLPAMLDILDEAGVKASFFLTGRWTEENPALAKEIAERGHELGNHAYSHSSPNGMSEAENAAEIEKTQQAIEEASGVRTTLYAPPSGECAEQVLAAAESTGHLCILWSADTVDWEKPEPAVITERALTKAEAGGIILMHPTEPTVAALPDILAGLQEKGLRVVTVSENLGAMGSAE